MSDLVYLITGAAGGTGPASLDIDGLAAEYACGLQRPVRGADIPHNT